MVHKQIELSDRDRCGPQFDVKATDRGASITFNGKTFITVNYNQPGMPRGFAHRTLHHLFDLLVARRTALWDEQTTCGPHPLMQQPARRRATHHARQTEEARDAGMANGAHLPPGAKP